MSQGTLWFCSHTLEMLGHQCPARGYQPVLESSDHEGLWHLPHVGSGVFLVPPTGWWSWLSWPLGTLLSHSGVDASAASSHSGGCGEQQQRALLPRGSWRHHWEGDGGLDPVGGFVLLPYASTGVHGQI